MEEVNETKVYLYDNIYITNTVIPMTPEEKDLRFARIYGASDETMNRIYNEGR